jgi:hypothetical protein
VNKPAIEQNRSQVKRRIAVILAVVFAVAVVMGPGPGIYLINPDSEEGARRLLFGMPIVYAWTAFWFGCQALVVVLCYRLLWREPEE